MIMTTIATVSRQDRPCALIMAGGTGGHIFPGLAIANALLEQGWRVHWMGAPKSMEERLVSSQNIPFEPVNFSGIRGKGWKSFATIPLRLSRAMIDSKRVLERVRPNIVIGFGGYISVPGGIMTIIRGYPLILHEQNSVAGWSNKFLAYGASYICSAYPQALPKAEWIGNPLRKAFISYPPPDIRFASRDGPLKILVLGGSLGAQALNEVVPQALSKIPISQRPIVTHQGGVQHIKKLQDQYAELNVEANLVAFIDDTARAMAEADLVICRAGASTITELAAIGVASILVPFPYAVDDHQTHNARFLVDANAAKLIPQQNLTPALLSHILLKTDRYMLLEQAIEAKKLGKTTAVADLVSSCEKLVLQQSRKKSL
jgi:UDP-N-acetylglucosamine--N-acetylmuramyl-(pentapeptide) pyrophosphoryl-undecaprenol N-acetylglucosamine transferase